MTARSGLAELSSRLSALDLWVLVGAVTAGLLGIGLYKEILYIGALGIAFRLAAEPGLADRLRPLAPALAIALLLLLDGELVKPRGWDTTAPMFLTLFLSIAACALSLATDAGRRPSPRRINLGLLAICAVFVIAHGAGCLVRGGAKGLFTNVHYLGLYAALTLPVLLCLLVERKRGVLGLLILLLLAGDFWLLLRSGSRPAWLALFLGALAVSPFLGLRHRTVTLLVAVVLPTGLYLTGWFDFHSRVDGLMKDFSSREERLAIWNETWRRIGASEPWRWGFGHGFDTYEISLAGVTLHGRLIRFDFPHNFLLELLYVGGILGLAMALAGYAGLFRRIGAHLLSEADSPARRGALLLLALTVIHLCDVFLTVSFFSGHNLVPLGLFLGLWLALFGPSSRSPILLEGP